MSSLVMSEMTYDDYLEHYGIKGMKWGVRKSEIRGAKRRKKAASWNLK